MPLLPRPSTALRTSHSLLQQRTSNASRTLSRSRPTVTSPKTTPTATTTRQASTQSTHGAAAQTQHGGEEHTGEHGHSDDPYEPPTGWLWGVPPGEQYQKEGWEGLWYWGFYGSLGLAAVAYAWKPDTSIETWALEEAKRRLQAEGTLPEDS